MEKDLVIKKSTIPNSGKGLFTKCDIKKGERIVEYLGEIISWNECDKRAERDEFGYVFYISKKNVLMHFTRLMLLLDMRTMLPDLQKLQAKRTIVFMKYLIIEAGSLPQKI